MAGQSRGPSRRNPAACQKKPKGNSGRRPIQDRKRMEQLGRARLRNLLRLEPEIKGTRLVSEEGRKVWEFSTTSLLAMRILGNASIRCLWSLLAKTFGRWIHAIQSDRRRGL